MIGPLQILRQDSEPHDQIKTEWLGAEARIRIPPRQPLGYRLIFWGRRVPLGVLLISFLSGFATCGSVVLIARGQSGGRQ